jgi:putative (di)nucleoside polyphosphate hydrolase
MTHVLFRAGVGAVIVHENGSVLAFQRSNEGGGWQLPQGGMELGETPLDSVYREILEETGIEHQDLKLIGEYPEWLAYQFPEVMRRTNKIIFGQVHRWFFFRYTAGDGKINLANATDDEFNDCEWISIDLLIERAIYFKKDVYRKLKNWLMG